MMEDDNGRLLMSDSLVGQIPDLDEDTVRGLEDSFVMAVLHVVTEKGAEPVVGSVVGVSFESDKLINMDIRTGLSEAFDLLRSYSSVQLRCEELLMKMGDTELSRTGPFTFTSLKILDFDHPTKMCTLGMDLVNVKYI